MKYDVIVVGSAVLDIYMMSSEFKKIPTGEYGGGVALCEEYGGKMEVRDVELTTGGGGTNNAVSYARKGFKVGIIAELGKDIVGETIKMELKKEGVDLQYIVEEKDEETGLSSIMVSDDGGRAVAVYRGASRMLTGEDIPWDKLETKWLYISSLGGQTELLKELLEFAQKKKIKVAVNPGRAEIEKLKDTGNFRLFEDVDVLIMNREEAQQLSKIEFEKEEIWKSDHCILGPKICVITDGISGGKVCDNGKCYFYEVSKGKVVETTGAGDAFGSGFVAALITGRDVESAILWGKKQAASVVSFMGPKKGLLSLEELV